MSSSVASTSPKSTSSLSVFSPSNRKQMRKNNGYGFASSPKNKKKKAKKKLTNEELMAKLEADLKHEQEVRDGDTRWNPIPTNTYTYAHLSRPLAAILFTVAQGLEHELDVGESAAAVALQANVRGGLLRDKCANLGREAGAVTLQSVQRGHSMRREILDPVRHPLEDPSKIADSAALMLQKLTGKIEPMLPLEDRTAVVWETKGWKDEHKEKLRKRGKWTEEDEKAEEARLEADRKAKEEVRSDELRTRVYNITSSNADTSVRIVAAANFATISNVINTTFFSTRFARRR